MRLARRLFATCPEDRVLPNDLLTGRLIPDPGYGPLLGRLDGEHDRSVAVLRSH